jgi:enoyl-CoA hydratase/carnithine racemase
MIEVGEVDEANVVTAWDVGDGILLARLDQPPANALGPPIIAGLHGALDRAAEMDARVVVISSAVEGFFAAGADIKYMAAADAPTFAAYGRDLRLAFERIAAAPIPTIAAIDGRALGGGLELALACTLRVASEDSRLGVPEAKLGLIPAAGGTQRLTRLVGRGRALEITLSARQVPAPEALAIGLIDRLAIAEGAEAAAVALARELAVLSRPALASIMRCVEAAGEGPLARGLALEASEVEALRAGADAQEGLTAFLERRPPRFV